jgi:hypothetical protein
MNLKIDALALATCVDGRVWELFGPVMNGQVGIRPVDPTRL